MLERNVGTLDRAVRAVIGARLLWGSLTLFSARRARPMKIPLVLAGAALVFTAATGYCMVYDLMGISTYKG